MHILQNSVSHMHIYILSYDQPTPTTVRTLNTGKTRTRQPLTLSQQMYRTIRFATGACALSLRSAAIYTGIFTLPFFL